MLDKITLKSHFNVKTLKLCRHVHNVVMDVIKFPTGSLNRFNYMALFHSQTRRHKYDKSLKHLYFK